jgi:hypothetical protein
LCNFTQVFWYLLSFILHLLLKLILQGIYDLILFCYFLKTKFDKKLIFYSFNLIYFNWNNITFRCSWTFSVKIFWEAWLILIDETPVRFRFLIFVSVFFNFWQFLHIFISFTNKSQSILL